MNISSSASYEWSDEELFELAEFFREYVIDRGFILKNLGTDRPAFIQSKPKTRADVMTSCFKICNAADRKKIKIVNVEVARENVGISLRLAFGSGSVKK